MDPETQAMVEQLAGGFPVPEGPPTVPNATKGLSPEALAALFLVPGRNWKLDDVSGKHVPTPTIEGKSGNYDIIHDKSGKVGNATLSWQPDKRNVHIDYMSAPPSLKKEIIGPGVSKDSSAYKNNTWAHTLGTKELKSFFRALTNTFPGAETADGLRISGARSLISGERPQGYLGDTAKFRLPRSQGLSGMPGTKLTDLW